MTTYLLVRHAAHDNVGGFLAGRTPGVQLGEAGRAQAARLGQRMRAERFDAILASPQSRTQETAEAIRAACGAGAVETAPELDEVDFGTWAGRGFDDLNQDPEWRRWNTVRSLMRTPAGEAMRDVQARVLSLMERLHGSGERTLVLVSHADPIKMAVAHALGLPVDAWPRLEVGPASITRIELGDWQVRLTGLNEVVT